MDNSLQVPLIVLCLLVVCYRLVVRYFHSGEHLQLSQPQLERCN